MSTLAIVLIVLGALVVIGLAMAATSAQLSGRPTGRRRPPADQRHE